VLGQQEQQERVLLVLLAPQGEARDLRVLREQLVILVLVRQDLLGLLVVARVRRVLMEQLVILVLVLLVLLVGMGRLV
jgi:hypothetical protein